MLEKDPAERFTWTEILNHPFVKEKITILSEDITDSPFTHPLTTSQNVEKEKQKNSLLKHNHPRIKTYPDQASNYLPNLDDRCGMSSHDSINVILQSDVENLETDIDDAQSIYMDKSMVYSVAKPFNDCHTPNIPNDFCFVTGNSNLIINHFNDNFAVFNQQPINELMHQSYDSVNCAQRNSKELIKMRNKNRDLEKRKLSQNLDNFSVRLGKSISATAVESNKENTSIDAL